MLGDRRGQPGELLDAGAERLLGGRLLGEEAGREGADDLALLDGRAERGALFGALLRGGEQRAPCSVGARSLSRSSSACAARTAYPTWREEMSISSAMASSVAAGSSAMAVRTARFRARLGAGGTSALSMFWLLRGMGSGERGATVPSARRRDHVLDAPRWSSRICLADRAACVPLRAFDRSGRARGDACARRARLARCAPRRYAARPTACRTPPRNAPPPCSSPFSSPASTTRITPPPSRSSVASCTPSATT